MPPPTARADDAADAQSVVARARAGDRDAMHTLYRDTYPAVTGFVARRVLPDQVEDVVAETYARALEALPRYRDEGLPMRAWLLRIALNLIIDASRSPKSRTVPVAAIAEQMDLARHADAVDPAVAWVEQYDAATALRRAFAALPEAQRAAVALRHLEGPPVVEAAAVLDITQESVRTLTHRGLLALRRTLAETTRDARATQHTGSPEDQWI